MTHLFYILLVLKSFCWYTKFSLTQFVTNHYLYRWFMVTIKKWFWSEAFVSNKIVKKHCEMICQKILPLLFSPFDTLKCHKSDPSSDSAIPPVSSQAFGSCICDHLKRESARDYKSEEVIPLRSALFFHSIRRRRIVFNFWSF